MELKSQGPVTLVPVGGFKQNPYPTLCASCNVRVQSLRGWVVPGPWRTLCARCSGTTLDVAELWEGVTGNTLRPYQKTGVSWLSGRQLGLLGDQPGLGKTIQALAAIPPRAPAVVVCPAIAKKVWSDHVQGQGSILCRPGARPIVCAGRGSWTWPGKDEVTIINYDILPRSLLSEKSAIRDIGRPAEGTHLVFDEVHYAKNLRSIRGRQSRHLRMIVAESGGSAWGMTGTPLKTREADLWGVLVALGLAYQLWPDFRAYATDMGLAKRRGKWEKVRGARPGVVDMLRSVMLRREKTDVLQELPPVTNEIVHVDIDAATRKAMDEAQALLEATGRDLETALREVGQDGHMMSVMAHLATAKIPHLIDLVNQHEESFPGNDHPLIVLSAHRAPCEAMAQRNGWEMIVGGTPRAERSRIIEEFQAGKIKGLALTITAAGTAITLTRSDRTIAVDMTWSPGDNEQAWDRNHRIGQRRPVTRTRIIADHPLDEALWSILERREETIAETISAARRIE